MESEIRCAKNPSEGWEGPRGSRAEGFGGSGNEVIGREDPVGPDQAGDLEKKREESKEVAHSSNSGQKPKTDRLVHEVKKLKKDRTLFCWQQFNPV